MFAPLIDRAVVKIQQKEDDRDFYFVKEVAALEGVSGGTITSILRDPIRKERFFPRTTKIRKQWQIPREDYEHYKSSKKPFLPH